MYLKYVLDVNRVFFKQVRFFDLFQQIFYLVRDQLEMIKILFLIFDSLLIIFSDIKIKKICKSIDLSKDSLYMKYNNI